jgi:hypothetical protein
MIARTNLDAWVGLLYALPISAALWLPILWACGVFS